MNFRLFVSIVSVAIVIAVQSSAVRAAALDDESVARYRASLARAQAGNVDAQFEVAELYQAGSGVAVDPKKAVIWYERAAKQSHRGARFKLAYLYYRGEGVDSNPSKAFLMMEQLAKEGYARAQFYLGLMYETGAVVARDLDQAATWYRRAAAGGHAPAAESLADLQRLNPALSPFDPETTLVTEVVPARAAAPESAMRVAQVVPSTQLAKVQHAPDPVPGSSPSAVAVVAPVSAEPAPPAVPAVSMTYATLIDGDWMASPGRAPVEFLPSLLTACEHISATAMQCYSRDMLSRLGQAEVISQTRATVSDMRDSGEFVVTYRKNVLKIIRDADASGAATVPAIHTGWQDTEHRLECKLENPKTAQCTKNNTQKLTLTKQSR